MFVIFFVSFAKSKEYNGIIENKINEACNGNYIFYECIFRNLGTYDSSSALYLHDGQNSQSVTLYHTTFDSCKANQGGAFSFTGNYNLQVMFVCIYKTSTNDKAGLWYVEMNTQPQFEYVSCFDSTTLCQTSLFGSKGPSIKNMNVSKCSATFSKTIFTGVTVSCIQIAIPQ